jgi:hypothetical protein
VLHTLAAVSLFIALRFLPTLPINCFIDGEPPRLKLSHSYLAENAGSGAGVSRDEEAILYRTRADRDSS